MLFFFVAAASLLSLASAYAPGNCTGSCEALDPTLIQRGIDGKYFRFSTGGGVTITTAEHLQGPWKDEGTVLTNGSKISIPGISSSNLWVGTHRYLI